MATLASKSSLVYVSTTPVSTHTHASVQLLQTLGSPVPEARHTSAQVVAKVAKIELPSNLWPTLVDTLLKGTVESPDDNTKQAALEALGYVCEDVVRASPSAHNLSYPTF